MKVTYRASLDEYVAKQSEFYSAKTAGRLNLFYIVLGMNLFITPAFLFYVERLWPAIILFVVSIVLFFVMQQLQFKTHRNFYAECFPSLETTDTTVEVNNEGLICSHEGVATFVPWKNISDIEGNTNNVSFITTPYCLYVPRRIFDDDEHYVAFVNEARSHKELAANA